MQLGNLIVSPDMLAGARQQEQQWERQLRDKQAELTGSTYGGGEVAQGAACRECCVGAPACRECWVGSVRRAGLGLQQTTGLQEQGQGLESTQQAGRN